MRALSATHSRAVIARPAGTAPRQTLAWPPNAPQPANCRNRLRCDATASTGPAGTAFGAPRPAPSSANGTGAPAAAAAGPEAAGQPRHRAVLEETRAFLEKELKALFTPTGEVTRARYSPQVIFEDPITRLDSLEAYIIMVRFLKTVFKVTLELHTAEITGPDEITARWTMSCLVWPLPWQPTAIFTGRSKYKVDVTSGLITSHRDYWDAVQNNSFLSVEAVALVVRQALDLSQTPKLETPKYSVLKAGRGYEIRLYRPFIVAEAPMGQGAAPAGGGGFSELAGYIFGQNSANAKMEMTTPVFSQQSDDGGSVMSFVMEDRFPDVSALPQPVNPGVIRKKLEGSYVAAARFPGWPLEFEVTRAERDLRGALLRDGLSPALGYRLARYNDPLTPPPLRRNEVLIDLPGFEWP